MVEISVALLSNISNNLTCFSHGRRGKHSKAYLNKTSKQKPKKYNNDIILRHFNVRTIY